MAKLYLRRTLSGFEPADEPSRDSCRKYKVGEAYRADIVKPRNYRDHCHCMALLTLTYENLPEQYENRWPTFKAFRRAIAEAAGYVEEYVTMEGEIRRIGLSLSYDSIPDNVEFIQVMGDMMAVCAQILGIETPELAQEVQRYATNRYGAAA